MREDRERGVLEFGMDGETSERSWGIWWGQGGGGRGLIWWGLGAGGKGVNGVGCGAGVGGVNGVAVSYNSEVGKDVMVGAAAAGWAVSAAVWVGRLLTSCLFGWVQFRKAFFFWNMLEKK